jgi:hypothetical protein
MKKRRGAKRVSGELILEGRVDQAQTTYLSSEWSLALSKLEISSDDVRRFCFTGSFFLVFLIFFS